QVSKPQVIIRDIDGVKSEPIERVQIDVPEDSVGSIIESIGTRKGEMLDMVNNGSGQVRLIFNVPARGLIGYTTEFMSITKGFGIINHTFDHYAPVVPGKVGGRHQGVLVSMENGKSTTYGMMGIEDRGTLFIEPGTEVYEGMVVGENNRDGDITVNITKQKQKTNIRSANKDQTNVIKKPRILT
ncbi:MAG: translational GTPase TypA, partial [Priestia megaterium]